MNRFVIELAAAILISLMTIASAFAHDYKLENLDIMHPHARATLPNAPVSGGYMIIKNTGETADRLVSVSADFAGKSEIHEMSMEGDVMKMRPLADGLEIPAGGEVVLKPGGYHVVQTSRSELQARIDQGYRFLAYGDDMIIFAEQLQKEGQFLQSLER